MTVVSGDKTSGDLTDCLAPHSLFLFHRSFPPLHFTPFSSI